MILMGIIANQIIDTSVKPSIIVMQPTVEGTAVFRYKNNHSKTVQLYYKSEFDTEWSWRNTSSGAYFDVTYDGEPGVVINVQAYTKTAEEEKSELVSNFTEFYVPPITAKPTVINLQTTKSGEAYFSIKNNEAGTVQIFYKKSTDTVWNSDYYLNASGTLYRTFTGTPGNGITLQVYSQGEYMKPSPTATANGIYYKLTTVAPLIEIVETTTTGYVKFKITNKDASSGTIYYKLSDEGTWNSTSLGIGGSYEIGRSGTPGATVVLEAYFAVVNQYNSTTVSKTGTYKPFRKSTAPTIALSSGGIPQNGYIDYQITSNDSDKGTLYWKRTTDASWQSKTFTIAGGKVNGTFTGTAGGSVTVQAYYIASTEATASDTVSKTGTYHWYISAKPTITNLNSTTVGKFTFRLYNNDMDAGYMYWRVGTTSQWDYLIFDPSTNYIDKTITGTPGEPVTIQAFFYASCANEGSPIANLYGKYYELPRAYDPPYISYFDQDFGGTTEIYYSIINENSKDGVMYVRKNGGVWEKVGTIQSGSSYDFTVSYPTGPYTYKVEAYIEDSHIAEYIYVK